MKRIIQVGVILVIGFILVYGGIVIYGNFFALNAAPYSMPDSDKASHSITIKNTGNTLLSNNVEQIGSVVILDGYWELVGQKFKYRDDKLVLDRVVFGPVTVRARQ